MPTALTPSGPAPHRLGPVQKHAHSSTRAHKGLLPRRRRRRPLVMFLFGDQGDDAQELKGEEAEETKEDKNHLPVVFFQIQDDAA